MQEAGFEGIWKAITRRQNTAAQYIATRPILDLCERATQRMGARVSRRWWDQEGIDLEEAKEMRKSPKRRTSNLKRSRRRGGGG